MGPASLGRKFRSVELGAGIPKRHAQRGTAFDYDVPAKRAEERSQVERAGLPMQQRVPMVDTTGPDEDCGTDDTVSP